MKKLICIVLAALMLMGNCYAFNDTDGHWAKTEIDKWSSCGIISGDGESLSPDDYITRGDFAVILDRIMNYSAAAENSFTDLDDSYYTLPLLRLNHAKVINGYDNKIRPTDNISRQEAVVLLSRTFMLEGEEDFNESFKDLNEVADWAMPYMTTMINGGYIKGSEGRLNPADNITRAETVKILDNITGGILNAESYNGLSRDKLTVITGDATITDSTFDGNVITVNGAKVHFVNSEIKGALIAQSPEKGSVKLENTTFGRLDAKNEYTVEIIEVEIIEEPVEEPVKEPEQVTEEEYFDEGSNDAEPEEPAIEDETIGEVVFCIEAFTVGGGYIIAPVKVDLYEGQNVAYILDEILTEKGLSYISTGSFDSGFYLSQINNLTGFSFAIPDVIREKLQEQSYEIIDAPYNENALGEFDFTQGSGWMYSVNNEFPGMGMCDCYPEDGAVIRVVFTTAYGSDVGGNNFAEYDSANDFFERVDRDALTRAIADQGIDAFADFMDIITKPDITQAEIDSLL